MSDVIRTIEMVGPGGHAVIPFSEKEAKLALGWKIAKEKIVEPKKEEEIPEFPKQEIVIDKPKQIKPTLLIPSDRSVNRTGLNKLVILNNDFQLGLQEVLDSKIPIKDKRIAINKALSELR